MTSTSLLWPHAPTPNDVPPETCIWLRLLETTDVHGHLLPFDYASGQEVWSYGLTRTASLIETARSEAENTLLFDNGDFLQGSALTDLVAAPGTDWTHTHPVVLAMNYLRYTAAALGNHEFNFGVPWLRKTLQAAKFPVLCANALTQKGNDPLKDETLLPPHLLLPVSLKDASGARHALKIGLVGLLPPQITTWDHSHLNGQVTARDMIETAQAHGGHLRAAGADLVIGLAHTGWSEMSHASDTENAALELAQTGAFDALMLGHTHKLFPDPTSPVADARMDHASGTIADVPSVMAGFRGSHLGVIDLCLAPGPGGWRVAGHASKARAVAGTSPAQAAPPNAALTALLQPAHSATLRVTSRPVGHSPVPLHSYLAQIRPCQALGPVLEAQRNHLIDGLASTRHHALPVLSAGAPFKTGDRGGPHHYTDISAGPLSLRSVADIYPFPNTLVGLCLTGAEIATWLERAASVFHQITPGQADQPLWNTSFPGHAFDTILGLTYQIDLRHPPAFDSQGQPTGASPGRVRNLQYQGQPLDMSAQFAVATSNYRAFGGGPYKTADPGQVIFTSQTPVRDILRDHLRRAAPHAPPGFAQTWGFAPMAGTQVSLRSGPGLRAYPDDMALMNLRDHGVDEEGFLNLTMAL